MRKGNQRRICIILAIMVALAGMCLEYNKTHSSFAYTPVLNAGAHVMVTNPVARGLELCCTTGMLCIEKDAQEEPSVIRLINSRKELKVFLDCSFFPALILGAGRFFTALAVVSFNYLYAEELVTGFVHKADGKKRRCLYMTERNKMKRKKGFNVSTDFCHSHICGYVYFDCV